MINAAFGHDTLRLFVGNRILPPRLGLAITLVRISSQALEQSSEFF
jgi:hypothetical protein